MKFRILNILHIFGLILTTLFYPEFSFAQGRNPEVIKALENLKKKGGINFGITWHKDQKRVKILERFAMKV